MNYSRQLLWIVSVIALCSFFSYGSEELIGESSPLAASSAQSYTGFKSGSQWLMPGLGYGNSLVGIDYEYGLSRNFGLQIGGGFVGMDFGINYHILPGRNFDLYLTADGNVIFGAGVVPGISLAMRGMFGEAARVGIGGKIGVGFCTFDRTLVVGNTVERYYPGRPLLIIGVTVPVRLF